MLVSESRFKSMTGKDIADATNEAQAVMQLRVKSRERVDELVVKALAAGGLPLHETNDQGSCMDVVSRTLDRHNWDAFYVDETAIAELVQTAGRAGDKPGRQSQPPSRAMRIASMSSRQGSKLRIGGFGEEGILVTRL